VTPGLKARRKGQVEAPQLHAHGEGMHLASRARKVRRTVRIETAAGASGDVMI
jgi:hypothetical protein